MPIFHPIPPVWDSTSRILILGSFPSVKSREQMFFYGHPQNRFWKVVSHIYHEPCPEDIPQKKSFLIRHHIAVWDVVASCDIEGSSDASMRHVEVNDINEILNQASILNIFLNGKTAEKYYRKYTYTATGREAITLPSTSPANAAWSLDRLIEAWRVIAIEKTFTEF